MTSLTRIATLVAASGVLLGCVLPGPSAPALRAQAQLQATKGHQASGLVTFTAVGEKVRIQGEVRGLQPNRVHGFHVHEKGDCSSGDGMSTGGHFNPSGSAHGAHGQGQHHAGDLVSLSADAQGVARFDYESKTITLGQGGHDVIGRGLIVHRDPDDFTTQPTGNSGPRIACAVISKV